MTDESSFTCRMLCQQDDWGSWSDPVNFSAAPGWEARGGTAAFLRTPQLFFRFRCRQQQLTHGVHCQRHKKLSSAVPGWRQ